MKFTLLLATLCISLQITSSSLITNTQITSLSSLPNNNIPIQTTIGVPLTTNSLNPITQTFTISGISPVQTIIPTSSSLTANQMLTNDLSTLKTGLTGLADQQRALFQSLTVPNSGNTAIVVGSGNTVAGSGHLVGGSNNAAYGLDLSILGNNNAIKGSNSTIIGDSNSLLKGK
jgi:hypothetical protein